MINLFIISNKYYLIGAPSNYIKNEAIIRNPSIFIFLLLFISFLIICNLIVLRMKKLNKKNLPHEGIEPPLPD